MLGYRLAMARQVAMLVLADVAWMAYRIGLVDAAGVRQQLLGNGRQRHIRCVAAAQPFHQVDGAVHIAARGQRLRGPLPE